MIQLNMIHEDHWDGLRDKGYSEELSLVPKSKGENWIL